MILNRLPYLSFVLAGGCCILVPGLFSWAAGIPDDFQLHRSTIDGGGEVFGTGGEFELSGTIGQPDAGRMGSGEFELTGGFWFAVGAGDCNTDGATNLVDYDSFHPCLSGPSAARATECRCYDLDEDGDVDLSDMAGFQQSFYGG